MSQLAVNTIRVLSADMIEKAASGHPGLPMGMADCAYVLWTKFLRYDPEDPQWEGRDRFVLSGGHGSALLYSMLHLSGYDYSLDDLKQFRQWGSRTPGHPEVELPGVETTTGPLGQGIANAVGMALAAKMTAARFPAAAELFNEQTVYTFCGDGDLMEGVSSEASSLAAHWKLDNLVCVYDSNRITIDGSTDLSFTENVKERYKAYGWHVQEIDGHDHDEISDALAAAKEVSGKPALIIARTHIGFGSPNKQDTSGVHGAPLGSEELKATKLALGLDPERSFHIPDEVRNIFRERNEELEPVRENWKKNYAAWKESDPADEAAYREIVTKTLPDDLEASLFKAVEGRTDASRSLSSNFIQILADLCPGLVGGSADLAASNKTLIKNGGIMSADNYAGRNVFYGIREFAMGAIMNGMALYGGYIPFGGTFLVFSDYMRSAIRMAAIMKIQAVYVFTHDSIFVGEDGPTHQPVEHLASLRVIPGLDVIRPADEDETAAAWAFAMSKKDGPTALILSRQKLPFLKKAEHFSGRDVYRGAYVLYGEKNEKPDMILTASGSETAVCLEAARRLADEGFQVRVVSVPSLGRFAAQDDAYKSQVFPPSCPRTLVVEAAHTCGWGDVIRSSYRCVSMTQFGRSAPYQVLGEKYGFTADAVYDKAKEWLKDQR